MTDAETTQQDKRLTKIQALLAKAERTNNPEEAATFTAGAQRLMIEWGIEEAMLQAHRSGMDPGRMERRTVDIDYSPFQTAHELLLQTVARANNAEVFFTPTYDFTRKSKTSGRARKISQATLFGYVRDLDFTVMLYTSLLLQAEREFRSETVQFRMKMETSHPGHRTRWRNSFNLGFMKAVKGRLAEIKRQAEQVAETSTPGTALVLADRKALVRRQFDIEFPNLGTKSSKAGGYAGGSDAGHAAGQRADLGQTGVRGGSRGELR